MLGNREGDPPGLPGFLTKDPSFFMLVPQQVCRSWITCVIRVEGSLGRNRKMKESSVSEWGPYGVLSSLMGIGAWFLGGMYSLAIGIASVALGFIGARNHQRLSLAGMLFGGLALMFVNLMNLGIIPMPSSLESDKSHLIKSIRASIRAFEVLKGVQLEDGDRDSLIGHFGDALLEARMVNTADVERQVPGFAAHYKNEFIQGVELLIEGYENSDVSKKLKGGALLDTWARWNRENRRRLGKIEEPAPSLISWGFSLAARG